MMTTTFYQWEIIVPFWVVDCIFCSNDSKYIDDIVFNLKHRFLWEREDDVAGFLALKIDRGIENGTISLTQIGLINRTLDATRIGDLNHKYTPVEKNPLQKKINGEPCCEEWNY